MQYYCDNWVCDTDSLMSSFGVPLIMEKYLTYFLTDEENYRHFYTHELPFHSPAPRHLEKLPDDSRT